MEPRAWPLVKRWIDGAANDVTVLPWEGTELGHSAWVHWTLTGDLEAFYESLRWPGWAQAVAALDPEHALALQTRQAAPVTELWDLQQA